MKIVKKELDRLSFEEFEGLSIEEKLTLLPLLPPKRRFDFLTDSKDADILVKESPVIDLMVTIKEIGVAGSGALLSLCDSEQIQYFIDLDTWNGYSFDKSRMHQYMMVMREWSLDTLIEKYTGLEYEQQLIYLMGDFKVYLSGEDFNPDEGAPEGTFTIEGVYYIQPLCDEEKFLLVKEILTQIFSTDHNLYLRLVEGIRQELYSNLEEDLYRFRSSRITELGFYEYEEAIGIYSEPTGITRDIIPKRVEPFVYSRLPIRYIKDMEFISSEFESIEERTALEILFELQVLINRLIVADRLEMFEIESVEESSSKVKSILRLGIDVIKNELGINPSEALKRFYVIDIFRHGYKKLKFIRDEARRIKSIHTYLKYTELPLYFEALLKIANTNFSEIDMRDIFSDAISQYPQSIDEINKLHELLLEIEASLDILIKCYDVTLEELQKLDKKDTNIPPDSKPTLFNILMTPLANMLLGYGAIYRPVDIQGIKRLCEESFIRDAGEVFLSERFLKRLEDEIFIKLKENNPRYQFARRIIGRTVEEYLAEMGRITDFSELRWEYISIILVKKNRF
ncbi:MAG: DUF6178 family protein [Myxococcota bacterium]